LRLYERNARFTGAPIFNVYRAGCEELAFHLLGSAEVDETFRARLGIADKISPAQMNAVRAAMERAVGETALELESQMILLATAVSGAPFLRIARTVWVSWTRSPTWRWQARQPDHDGAWRFGRAHHHRHCSLCRDSGNVRLQFFWSRAFAEMIVQMDNFAAELASEFEHKIRRAQSRLAELAR